jgi:uncharacterized protein YjiS (DUF1127 family)
MTIGLVLVAPLRSLLAKRRMQKMVARAHERVTSELQIARTIHYLRSLDDHLLADMGFSRATISRQVRTGTCLVQALPEDTTGTRHVPYSDLERSELHVSPACESSVQASCQRRFGTTE